MTGEPVQFPVQHVLRHADRVEQAADALAAARSAVHEVTMDDDAYGILCRFLPAILGPVFERGADALHSSADALHDTAAKLRRTAGGMVGTDQVSESRIVKAIELPL